MTKNMGAADRIIRTSIAITLAILYYRHIISGTSGMVLLVIALVLMLTSISAFCPLYSILKINSCAGQDHSTKSN